jgi:hypothetical protein
VGGGVVREGVQGVGGNELANKGTGDRRGSPSWDEELAAGSQSYRTGGQHKSETSSADKRREQHTHAPARHELMRRSRTHAHAGARGRGHNTRNQGIAASL